MDKGVDNAEKERTMKIVWVSRTEFRLEDGRAFPIDPPLKREMTPSEFQKHYDIASAFIEGIRTVGDDPENTETLGRSREDQDRKEPG